MIQLLFTVIHCEAGIILALLFKTPLRKFVIFALDNVKRERGPVVVKTIAGTVFVVFLSTFYSMAKIQSRGEEGGGLNPTDDVIMARLILEASLMGFALFNMLMIDRLHHYIKELRALRKLTTEGGGSKKQNQGTGGGSGLEEGRLTEEITMLQEKIRKVEGICMDKEKEKKAAEAEVEALKKQSESFLLEYDRVLEDNQSLRSQLNSFDLSETKKTS